MKVLDYAKTGWLCPQCFNVVKARSRPSDWDTDSPGWDPSSSTGFAACKNCRKNTQCQWVRIYKDAPPGTESGKRSDDHTDRGWRCRDCIRTYREIGLPIATYGGFNHHMSCVSCGTSDVQCVWSFKVATQEGISQGFTQTNETPTEKDTIMQFSPVTTTIATVPTVGGFRSQIRMGNTFRDPKTSELAIPEEVVWESEVWGSEVEAVQEAWDHLTEQLKD